MRTLWLLALLGCGSSASSVSPPVSRPAPAPAPAPAPVAPSATAAPPSGGVEDLTRELAPAPDGSLGMAGAAVLEAVADDGSWVVMCQARADTNGDGRIGVLVGMHGHMGGDLLEPYLVIDSGTGLVLTSLVAFSRDWIAARRGSDLVLIDVPRRRATKLVDADLRDDQTSSGPPRAATIARNGTRMAYMRHGSAGDSIVVRELPSGDERAIAVDGVLWRIELSDNGGWVRLYVIRQDTDGDGKLAWPIEQTSLSQRGCRGPVGSYTSAGIAGDQPVELWLELATGTFMAPNRAAARFSYAGAACRQKKTATGIALCEVGTRSLVSTGVERPQYSMFALPAGPLRWSP